MIGRVVGSQEGAPEEARSPAPSPDRTWIIVCEHFHGALGLVPTERLADELAALASEMGGCTYRPVRLVLARGRSEAPPRPDEPVPTKLEHLGLRSRGGGLSTTAAADPATGR